MGILQQQSLKASIVTYMGVLLGIINVFIVFPLFLSKEVIGLIKALEAIGLIVVPFIYLGLPFAINKFYPIYKNTNTEKLKSVLSKMFVLLVFNSVLVSVLFYVFRYPIGNYFSDKSPLLSKYILLSIPVFVGMCWLVIFSYLSSSNLRIVVPRIMERIVIRIFQLFLIVLFYVRVINEYYLILLFSFSYVLPAILLYFYVKKNNFSNFSFLSLKSDFNVKEETNYTILLSLHMLGSTIITNVGMVIISALLGLEYTAIFFIAFYMGFILEVPAINFSLILKPILSDSLEKNDLQNVDKLYKKSSIIQAIVSGILLILLSANIEEIFIIMPNGNEYIEGKWVVLIIGLGLVIKSFMGCNFDILTMSKHYKQSVIVTACMSIATIGIYYAFTIAGGINGAAIAALITTITYSIITSVIIFKHYNIIPFNNKTLPLLIVLLLTYLLSTYLPSFENPYFSIILKSIVIFTIYIIAVYYFKISSDINEHIRSVFAKFKAN